MHHTNKMFIKWRFVLSLFVVMFHEGLSFGTQDGCPIGEKLCGDQGCKGLMDVCDGCDDIFVKKCRNGECQDMFKDCDDEENVSDPCFSRPCKYGDCSTTANGGYSCACYLGYTDINCNTPIASCEINEKLCSDYSCVDMFADCECDGYNEIKCSSGICVDRHSEDGCDPPNHAQPFYYVLVGVALIVVILIIVCKRRCAKKRQGTTAGATYSAQPGQDGQPLNTVNLDFSGTRMQPVTNVNNTTNNQTNPYAPPVYGPTMAGANPYPPPMNSGAAPPYPPVSTGAPAYPPASAGGPTYPTGAPAYPPASAGGPTYPTGAPAYPPASTGGPTYPTGAPAYPPASTGGPPNPSAPPADSYHYTPPADLPPPPCYDDAVTTKT